MERARKTFPFSDGREVVVKESTWDTAGERSALETQYRAEKASLNGSGDPVYFYFIEAFYCYMASCSTGSVPSAREALELPSRDLDGWYLSVVSVNPESFKKVDYSKEGEVVFRDGSSFRILSSYLPSVVMKRVQLEEDALKREEDREHPKDIFAVYLYPILASCSSGDVPDVEEIRSNWPESEVYKWRDAVAAVNPQWFMSAEQEQERTLVETRELEKKSKKSRVKSPSS